MRGPAFESLPRRRPRGAWGCAQAPYGDLKVADGARGSGLEREAESRGARDDDEELV